MGHPERIPVPASVYCEAYNYALSPTRGGSGGAVTNLPQKEQSEVFFSVTKLFQNKDVNLRRMVRPRNWQQRLRAAGFDSQLRPCVSTGEHGFVVGSATAVDVIVLQPGLEL